AMHSAVRIDLTGLRHRPAHTSGRYFTTPFFHGTARRGPGRSALYTPVLRCRSVTGARLELGAARIPSPSDARSHRPGCVPRCRAFSPRGTRVRLPSDSAARSSITSNTQPPRHHLYTHLRADRKAGLIEPASSQAQRWHRGPRSVRGLAAVARSPVAHGHAA